MKDTIETLRAEARAAVASYDPEGDFEDIVLRLADIGFRLEAALRKV